LAELLFKLGDTSDRRAIDFHNGVTRSNASFVRRRFRSASRNQSRIRKHIRTFEANPQDARVEIGSSGQLRQYLQEALQRNRKANARVIPFDPRDLAVGVWREWHQNAERTTGDIDQRSAIVGWRNFGIGLNRATP